MGIVYCGGRRRRDLQLEPRRAGRRRRAGINVAWVRTFAFTLVGLTAGFAGIVYESRLGSISVGFDGAPTSFTQWPLLSSEEPA
ncbi:MAG: hypothetical protein ABSC31_11405 [Acidimicrobiales bacterium]|jgi:D-xylose transport system permease protein